MPYDAIFVNKNARPFRCSTQPLFQVAELASALVEAFALAFALASALGEFVLVASAASVASAAVDAVKHPLASMPTSAAKTE